TYTHPESVPEGNTVVYWFKGGMHIPAFNDQLQIPYQATRVGDEWYFTVTPRTAFGVQGPTRRSPSVIIAAVAPPPTTRANLNGDGKVDSVDVQLVINAAVGLPTPGVNCDVDGDNVVSATDVQLVINAALEL
ncbi:MAG: hypothetical protein HY706_02665, partial [Candidatus Hydrogenedentes bacterium]|nr:hypothetical protein [Candidatus Hydrogenedentota bacterium]